MDQIEVDTGIFESGEEDESIIDYTVQTITSLNTLYQRDIDPYEVVGISVYRELSRRRLIQRIQNTIQLEQTLNIVSDYFTRRTLEIINDFSIEENLRRELHQMIYRIDDVAPIEYPGTKTVEEPCQCSICFEDVEENSEIYNIPCKHVFHKDCLSKWIERRKHSCPLCRRCIIEK